MKKRIAAAAAVLMLALSAFSGCGSISKTNESISYDGGYGNSYFEQDSASNMARAEYAAEKSAGTFTNTSLSSEKKLIKQASVSLVAKDTGSVYEAILADAKAHGGYEFTSNKNINDNGAYIVATIKVPYTYLSEFVDFIGRQGKLVQSRTESTDVTDEYYDTKLRLDTKKAMLEKYYEFLKSAKNIEEMLSVQREITSLTAEIEAAEGRIKMWDANVEESTVVLYLSQDEAALMVNRDFTWTMLTADDMGYYLKSGFFGFINIAVKILQFILIAVVTVSPMLIILAVIIVPLVIAARRKAKKTAEEKKQVKQDKQ